MSLVSNLVLRDVAALIETAGFDAAPAFDGLEPSLGVARSSRRKMEWDDFCCLLERAEDIVGGPERLERATRETPRRFALLSALARVFSHPRFLYRLGARWFGPTLIPVATATESELADGRYAQTVEIDRRHADCDPFFTYAKGFLALAPTHFGLPAAPIEMIRAPRSATYVLSLPALERSEAAQLETSDMANGLVRELLDDADTHDLFDWPSPAVRGLGLLDRMGHAIDAALADNGASAHEIASRLGLSERSLKRRLRAQGTTFREVRDERRREIAIRLLESGEPIERVASRVGYSEASAFHRAFKRWTARTPGDFRGEERSA